MSKSLSLDLRSEQHSRKHNMREIELANVNSNLSYRNIVLKDEKLVDVYHMLFDDAVKQYNEKQTRADRKKGDYFKEIKASKKYKTCYEMVVQIGDRKDTGIFNDDLEVQALERYYDEFQERNPSLYCFSAVIHRDEQCSHLHLAFTPVAHAETNIGMQLTPSLSLALKQQGVEPDMSHKKKQKGKKGLCSYQIGWEHREREYIKNEICKDLGIEIKSLQEQERKHFNTDEYKEYREMCNLANKHYRESRKKRILEEEKLADKKEELDKAQKEFDKKMADKKEELDKTQKEFDKKMVDKQKEFDKKIGDKQKEFNKIQKNTEKLDKYAKKTLENIKEKEEELNKKLKDFKDIDKDTDELLEMRDKLEKMVDKEAHERYKYLGLDGQIREMTFEDMYNKTKTELDNLKKFCDNYLLEDNYSILDEFENQEQQIRIEIEREKRKKQRERKSIDDDDDFIL